VLGDKFLHHFHAFWQIEVDHFHPVAAHEIRRASKRPAFAYDDFGNLKLNHCAGAEVTRHQSGIEDRVTKVSDPAGISQTINFGMRDRVVILHSLVMSNRN